MQHLDKTPLLCSMQKWLDSSDEYVMTTSVLAFGNYARTDNHCIKLVEDNVANKLIEILRKNDSADSDARLQHALVRKLIKNWTRNQLISINLYS
jgi:hypothetical protein